MATMDLLEDLLDETLSMIDPRWGCPFGAIFEVLKLQRRSPDGWARVSYARLAKRFGVQPSTMWAVMGTGPSTKKARGSLWRQGHVLVLGPPRAGRRPQAYALNPAVDQWQGVRWREADPEIRQWRLDPYLRELRRVTENGVSARLPAAERTRLAPRLVAAELRTLVPRTGANNNGAGRPAAASRGTTIDYRPPSPSRDVEDVPSSPSGFEEEQQQQTSDFVERLKAALWSKTGRPTGGRLLPQLARYEATTSLEELVKLIMAAPSDMQPPRIVEQWIPNVLRFGLPPAADDPTPQRDPEVDRIQRELAKVERQIHAERLAGEEPPPYLVADRDRWQNELDQMTGAQR